nr:helix-turn-helix transcriptional regulator [Alicyclobacillus macrosporangiidus]
MVIRLREFRKAKGLTQADLSKLSGVPQSVISDIETGTAKNPTVTVLAKLAKALGVTLDELVDMEEVTTNARVS